MVPPSRLYDLCILTQLKKFTYTCVFVSGLLPPGTQFDLFRGTAAMKQDVEDTYPTILNHTIKVHIHHRNLIACLA